MTTMSHAAMHATTAAAPRSLDQRQRRLRSVSWLLEPRFVPCPFVVDILTHGADAHRIGINALTVMGIRPDFAPALTLARAVRL